MIYLKAQRQHCDRSRARDQPAGEPEHDDLTRRHIPGNKPAPDLVGMGQHMGVPM